MTTLVLQVGASLDDAGGVFPVCSTTTIVDGAGTNGLADRAHGMRFTGLAIPPGSVIDTATMTFVPFTSVTPVLTKLLAHAHDNSPDFSAGCDVHTVRLFAPSLAQVDYDVPNVAAWPPGIPTVSPDVAAIVQEISDRSGRPATFALMMLWHDDGSDFTRFVVARAYDLVPANAPILTITFTPPPAVAPHVVDATVGVNAAQDATVSAGIGESTISAKPTEDKTI